MKWLVCVRWTYNKCLDTIQRGTKRNKKTLRAAWLNSDALSDKSLKWVLETTYDICNQAINDLLKAFKSCFAKGGRFQIKHRSRKDKQQSIVIDEKHWGRKKGAYAFLTQIKASFPLSTKIEYDSRIKRKNQKPD